MVKVSVIGLKHKSPAIVSAATNSGEATKACVLGLPSFLFAKFRLNDVTIEFGRSGFSVSRFHCPIQGPQAFAIMVAPTSSNSVNIPSRSAVKRTCSEPGLIINWALTDTPFDFASFTIEAALDISSYEELVQEPIKPTSIV